MDLIQLILGAGAILAVAILIGGIILFVRPYFAFVRSDNLRINSIKAENRLRTRTKRAMLREGFSLSEVEQALGDLDAKRNDVD